MTEDTLVRAESLVRVYGGGRNAVTAVVDATFTVGPGELIALVGPSGSGKSTLLHLIAGLDRPTSGTISWPALGPREGLRPGPVGIAFQGPSLLPPLTVIENAAMPLMLAGGSATDAMAAASDLLDAFGVGSLESKLPEELSGGQAQRVGLARAFVGSPRLVLADEPTGQQDHETASRVMDAALTIAALQGTAFLIATHDRTIAGQMTTQWSVEDGHLRTEAIPCSV